MAACRIRFLVIDFLSEAGPFYRSAFETERPLTQSICMIMHYSVNTIPVGVLGASGYAGRELCALLLHHPRFSLAFATANEQRGQTVRLAGKELTFQGPDDAALDEAAVVFCALPHGASLPWVMRAREAG